MGEHNVEEAASEEQIQAFTVALLEDIRALELMLEKGMIETGVYRPRRRGPGFTPGGAP